MMLILVLVAPIVLRGFDFCFHSLPVGAEDVSFGSAGAGHELEAAGVDVVFLKGLVGHGAATAAEGVADGYDFDEFAGVGDAGGAAGWGGAEVIGDAGGECVVVKAVGDEVGDLGDEWVVHVIRHFSSLRSLGALGRGIVWRSMW